MGGGEPYYDEHFERFVYKLTEGNPGAITAVREMLKDDYGTAAMALGYLAAVKIRGPLIWLCYKDICHNDAHLMLQKITTDTLPKELADLQYSGYKAPKRFDDI